MKLHLSSLAADSIVNVIAALIDNGPSPGRVELLSDDRRVLASLSFARPCTLSTKEGELTFAPITEDHAARGSGKAVTAQIVDGGGNEIFSCDVSDLKGDGLIQLNTNQIVMGGPVRIRSFTLSMPT